MKLLFVLLCVVACIALVFSADSVEDKFIDWFRANGGVLNHLKIDAFEGMGRGFRATADIAAGNHVMEIPAHLQFTMNSMKSSSDPAVQRLRALISDPDLAITAWVLLEKYRGEDSFFAPYLAILPSHVSSVLYFTGEELEELQDPVFVEQIISFQQATQREFDSLQQLLSRETSTALHLLSTHLTLSDYLWSSTILHSRGLRFRGQVHLSPMADVFNYAPHPVLRLASNGDHFLQHHTLHSANGSLSIFADRFCAKNTHCVEDYGDNSNQIYLQYHGFVPLEENPFHCLTVRTQSIVSHFRQQNLIGEATLRLIAKLGLDRAFNDCLSPQSTVTKSVSGLLALLSLSPTERDDCLSVLTRPEGPQYKEALQVCMVDTTVTILKSLSPLDPSLSLSLSAYYPRLLQTLQTALTAETQRHFRFETSIAEDEALLLSPEAKASEHYRLALLYRLSNKRLIVRLQQRFGLSPLSPVLATGEEKTIAESRKEHTEAEKVSKETEKEVDVSVSGDTSSFTTSTTSSSSSDSSDLFAALDRFNSWFQSTHPPVCKLRAVTHPVYRVATYTTAAVQRDEVYLQVPPEVILDAEKAFLYSGISPLLQQLSLKYSTRDDFHELLLFLLYETFVQGEQSTYWPYLAVLPRYEDLAVSLPLFWEPESIVRRLSPSALVSQAVQYRRRALRKYQFLSNLTMVRDFFAPLRTPVTQEPVFTLERYLWATAILDSRSIWWSNRRHLVPMLDFINCATHAPAVSPAGGANEQSLRVHSTTLDAKEKKYAETKAGGDFAVNTQLFENYGQPNHVYYQFHGFILPDNAEYDCLSFDIALSEKDWQRAVEYGVQDYLEQLGLSAQQRVYSACLRSPLPAQLWNVLGVMTGQTLSRESQGLRLPSSPTLPALRILRRLLKDRLSNMKRLHGAAYCAVESSDMAQRFLCLEQSLVDGLLQDLKEVQESLELEEE